MKQKAYKWMMGLCLMLCAFTSCQNDDYLKDGGTSSPYYDGNVMQFLESRPDIFTDLVTVLKYSGLDEILANEEVTFFAPTDFSIQRSIEFMNKRLYSSGRDQVTMLEQVKPEVWKDLLSMYIIEGKYRLNDIAQIDTAALSTFPGQTNFTYLKNYKMTMGVVYNDAGGVKYAGYRQIMYIYPVGGYRETSYVATSNIEPHNGIVHVIRFDHYLAFDYLTLYSKAVDAGIDYDAAPLNPNTESKE